MLGIYRSREPKKNGVNGDQTRDLSSSANPLVRYCHFGVSPVNYSDSEMSHANFGGFWKIKILIRSSLLPILYQKNF